MFKKKLLAAAILLGSTQAYAVNLIDDSAIGVVATEVDISGSGTSLASTAAELDVASIVGFTIPLSSTYYVRYDLTNATFGTAVQAVDLTISDSDAANTAATATISTGGTDGDDFVIFAVTTTGGANDDVDSTETFSLVGVDDYDVTGQSTVSIQAALYETAGNAVSETTALSSDSGSLVSFSAGFAASGGTGSAKQIDVTNGSSQFVGSSTCAASGVSAGTDNTRCSEIMDLDINLVTGTQGLATNLNTDLAINTLLADTTALVVSGDFSASQDLTSGAPDGTYSVDSVFYDNDGGCDDADIDSTALTATTATFTTTDAGGHAFAAAGNLCIAVNGVTLIGENQYTAVYTPVTESGFSSGTVSVTGSTLAKNGSTANVELLLTPGGAFSNFVRVSNTSTVDGDVFITLWNDSGDNVQFNLSDVSGISTNQIDAGGSSGLIDISDLYAAAQAADSTFDVGTGKLRADVEGEFATIDVQAITVSTDGTTFSTF